MTYGLLTTYNSYNDFECSFPHTSNKYKYIVVNMVTTVHNSMAWHGVTQ